MRQVITKSVLLLILPYLIFSCSPAQERTDKKRPLTNSGNSISPVAELTLAQQSAFDALNTLQTSTDQMNRLYSTFANIQPPCYPTDTSFIVSQSELLIVLKQFISNNCTKLTVEEQNELAETSVLAQEEYKILHCSYNSLNEDYENGLPLTGTWVMPSVLGRRDVILVW